ncbi:hypothetical protein DACRYDRAFT_111651 [Dacryopinax primogenitus]|uniref:RRM domain-containing protein n=1 Tax=Dacryopinax primogenitus (strain DJM 731) TaxID=1858805 RepID=M5G1H4_DACPD|nr:uncharacterized protein DACRYDRAFT_111651 [Dacryopinax primogenitus]EJT97607.1 hypothetical protein DACRYDRAFT_111651 [Dacryopinax primogenitus]
MSEPTAAAPQLASAPKDAVPAPTDAVKPQENVEVKVNGANGAAVEEPAGPKVFAGNLAYITSEEGLRGFFKEFEADILHVNLVHRGPRPAGYAFVTFSALERAEVAVTALNDKELDGRKVAVQIAKPVEEKEKKPKKKRTRVAPKRVGEVTEEEAEGEGAAEPAPATHARIDVPETVAADAKEAPKKKKPARKPKPARRAKANGDAAPGEATEGAKAPATKAAQPAPESDEKATRVKKPRAPPRPRRPAGTDPVGTLSPNMLFVANLPFTVTDQTLAEMFTSAGINIVSARIVRRRWPPRRSKGYGFVDVGDEAAQKKGIEAVNGKQFEGREVAVKVAVNTQLEDAEKEEAAQEGSSPEATVLAT